MGPVRISPSPPPTNIDRKLNARGCGGVGASCRVRIDPGYIGWREWPADVPVYIAGRQRPTRSGMRTCSLRALRPLSSMLIASFTSASRAGDPVGFAVEKLDARVASPAFWTAAIAYLSQEHAKVERVVSANVSFFKSVFRHYGFAALTAMKEPFERVCKATTERSSQRAAAEIVAGLLRGSKLWCVFPPATLHPPPAIFSSAWRSHTCAHCPLTGPQARNGAERTGDVPPYLPAPGPGRCDAGRRRRLGRGPDAGDGASSRSDSSNGENRR